MQYLVRTGGEVVCEQDKSYLISARSKEAAQEIAKERFAAEFSLVNKNIYTQSYDRTFKALIAIALMLVAVIISYQGWEFEKEAPKILAIFGKENSIEKLSINPDLDSCLYAAVFYFAFVVRFKGIKDTIASWIDVASCIIVILLLASFINIILSKDLLFGKIKPESLLIIGMIFSWLGLKLISVICMALVALLSLTGIDKVSEAMGAVWGPIYILCAFVGFLFYLSTEPALIERFPQFRNSFNQGVRSIKNDFVEAGHTIKDIRGKMETHTEQKD